MPEVISKVMVQPLKRCTYQEWWCKCVVSEHLMYQKTWPLVYDLGQYAQDGDMMVYLNAVIVASCILVSKF